MDELDHDGFARHLRQHRLTIGLTVDEAAAAAGRSVATWEKYEATGRGYITGPLIRYADKYDVSLDWLFIGHGRPPAPRLRIVRGAQS